MHPSTQTQATHHRETKAVLERKPIAKSALQKDLGWPIEPKRAMLCIPTGLKRELGGDLFKELIGGLLTQPIEIVILGKGSKEYGALATDLAQKHDHRLAIIPNQSENRSLMLEAADMALFLGDPSDLPELSECLRSGVVPIALECRKLMNYNPVQETGNAFLFEKPNTWHCFAAVVRALETHVFPFDWRTIQKHCLESIL